jgi:hypothetical protein
MVTGTGPPGSESLINRNEDNRQLGGEPDSQKLMLRYSSRLGWHSWRLWMPDPVCATPHCRLGSEVNLRCLQTYGGILSRTDEVKINTMQMKLRSSLKGARVCP